MKYVRASQALYLISLTLFLVLVNSLALFSLYPAFKDGDVSQQLFVTAIYIILVAPLVLVTLLRRIHINRRQLLVGLGLFLLAVIVQTVLSADKGLVIVTALIYLLTAFVEELLWRGTLWNAIYRLTRSNTKTYLLVTLHFVVLHIPFALARKETPLLFLGSVLALGLVLGALRIFTKRTTLPTFIHAAVNVVVRT